MYDIICTLVPDTRSQGHHKNNNNTRTRASHTPLTRFLPIHCSQPPLSKGFSTTNTYNRNSTFPESGSHIAQFLPLTIGRKIFLTINYIWIMTVAPSTTVYYLQRSLFIHLVSRPRRALQNTSSAPSSQSPEAHLPALSRKECLNAPRTHLPVVYACRFRAS